MTIWLIVGWVTPYGDINLSQQNISSGDGLLPDSVKSFPHPPSTNVLLEFCLHERNFTTSVQIIILCNKFEKYKFEITVKSHSDRWVDNVHLEHDDVIKWKSFPRYGPFVRGIHLSPMNSPNKGQRRGAWMFSLICTWTNGLVNHPDADDWRHHRAHYDITLMEFPSKHSSRWNVYGHQSQACNYSIEIDELGSVWFPYQIKWPEPRLNW